LVRNHHRKALWRFRFWSLVCCVSVLTVPAAFLGILTVCGSSGLFADNPKYGPQDTSRGWMVPRKHIAGLFGDRTSSNRAETTPETLWKAEVTEAIWQYIVIHHSATHSGSVNSIHNEHRRRKDGNGNPWLGIGYHFVIGNGQGMTDGAVEPTFRWAEQLHGAHSGQALFNSRGIGICLIGNFEDAPPSKSQWQSVRSLVNVLAGRHGIAAKNIIGHSAVKNTSCPGKHFPLKDLQKSVNAGMAGTTLR
jgi:hypothetical protein